MAFPRVWKQTPTMHLVVLWALVGVGSRRTLLNVVSQTFQS